MHMDIPGGLGGGNVDCNSFNDSTIHKINVPFSTDELDEFLGLSNNNCCKDENKARRAGTTNLNKSYYTDSKTYLKSRGKTYKQNITGSHDTSNKYTINTNSDAACKNTYVYKPSNKQFATQGAVSSSSRLERLKLNTIQVNNASLRTAWGAYGANGGKYHGTMTSPYFLKSNVAVCNKGAYHKNHKNACK